MTIAIVLTKSAQKDVDALPATIQARVAQAIVTLRNYPNVSGVKPLKGALKGILRLRVGSHRILFTFGSAVITITAVDDRKEAY